MRDVFQPSRIIAVVIQASMCSTRLPGKSLADLCGKPLIHHVIERARRIRRKHVVALATTTDPRDDALWRTGHEFNLFVDRSKPKDVLGQFHKIAEAEQADVIVRITGDCPLIDPAECDRVIDEFLQSDTGYASNRFPVMRVQSGFDCEVFSAAMLKEAHESTADAYDREHVSPWMVRRIMEMTLGPKLSVDTAEELERVRSWIASS